MTDFEIRIGTGTRDRKGVVLQASVPDGIPCEPGNVRVQARDIEFPGQITERRELLAILPDLPAGTTLEARVSPAEISSRVQLQSQQDRVDVLIEGEPFTSYQFAPIYAKPFLAPIIGPYGDPLNRPIDPSIREHPHQRGIFIAHGDVCGEEIWNEPAGRHGRCVQRSIQTSEGAVAARLIAENTWEDRNGRALMDETRTITIYALPAQRRILDLELHFVASYGEVKLGATKEAGFLGIRVHPDISTSSQKGGCMENCYGAVGEAECWGKRAHWCDYHGMLNGHRVGIAAFDHPANLRFPTHWHIRGYGLFAANPWYWSGEHTIPAGDSLTFRYRIVIHAGDTREAQIAEQFIHYDVPPTVQFI